MQLVFDLRIRGVFFCDTDFCRIVEQSVCQLADLIGEGRRKQQILALSWEDFKHAFYVVNKAHVEHAIGFIQYENIQLVEFNGVLAMQVQQASRSGDEHFGSAS